ncbi:uncharacterized protein LOC107827655 isoform X1 [Nicotiana tabacum]|uniref:Uncharacterized protein LOC107827655 isoform X1 n=2 Tax=Nicotiana TaxID=4085 RepID=A0A1S4DAC6_TOBAC|nr:PREDICTED: uncharacterized protein LOC104238654 isoform X1 [Nicotiana sylvestris]XP_009791387.1 PREDICTED: uncharacterized protein LOC104238654 isoform X1 [Nicotiana sylvestris]
MGSLLNLIDFDQGAMARKFLSNKRHGGLDAPRNSMEFPVEASQRFCAGGDNGQCTYHMIDWPEKNSYGNEAPMKKLIREEIARRPNTGHSAPSVVARLMGVDALPLDTRRSSAKQVEKKNEMIKDNRPKEEWLRKVSVDHATQSSRQKISNSSNHDEACDFDRQSDSQKLNKYKPREHPQEEELQKFKKDFEAWQAARFKECSKFVELGTSPSQWLAQQSLNKEKLTIYANSMRTAAIEKPIELRGPVTVNPQKRGLLEHQKNINEFPAPAQNKTNCVREVTPNPDQQRPLTSSYQGLDVSSGPTKIVILRPCPDRMGTNEESWASSPGISEDRGSIEEFLEEVKERLNCELQGKSSKRITTVRGGGIETPYSEMSPDAKQIAKSIAKHARESVTRDFEITLPRSESTRSYRSDIQFDGTSSPEFVNRDTRRFLTERLRNVLKQETSHGTHRLARGSSISTVLNKEKCSAEEIRYTCNTGDKATNSDNLKDEIDMHSRSFRRDPGNDVMLEEDLSPRNLIRSLSAPVSGTSFGKLLLEDRHMLTGAHIRRKHETIEKATGNVKKRQKEKFNLRRKVSSFSYSFILKGRLFGRKVHSWEEPHGQTYNLMKDFPSPPTGTPNFYERHENPTEVPPSPASVCSSVNEEYWRQTDYFTPSSTSDVHPLDDSEMPRVFREISTNLNELRRQLNQLDTYDSEDTMIDEQPVEEEMLEIEDKAEAYIRDLLVASGLYDGSRDKYISRWDPLGKPISNQVFEEAEKSYIQKTKDEEGYTEDQLQRINHKLLCDLLNEALPSVLGGASTMSRFMKSAVRPIPRPPQGKKLLERVWEIVGVYVYPPWDRTSQSLDNIVDRDLKSTPWSGLVDEDVNALGKDMECQIIGDLIREMVQDMLL